MRRVSAWSATTFGWLLAMALPVAAQQVTLEPSAAVACMTPAAGERGVPEYPFVAYKSGLKGRVKVVLSFTSPDTRPAVEVTEQDGDDSFVDAVKAHVRQLRVPCHDGGEQPVRLTFDFQFRPDDREVFGSGPTDADAAARKAQLACMVHESGEKSPGYPDRALRNLVQGRVVVRLRFEAPDQAPTAEFISRADAQSSTRSRRAAEMLSEPLEAWVKGYRLPCLQGRPITTTVVFVYRFDGDAYGFKPGLSLMDLLPTVRNIKLQRLDFDFNRMACPFDVAMTYYQPHRPNQVVEVGSHDPARQPFLDWLRQSQLNLPERSLDSVFGDTARFTVPCLKIKLQPQEPT
jgi:hypothetical protein